VNALHLQLICKRMDVVTVNISVKPVNLKSQIVLLAVRIETPLQNVIVVLDFMN